MADPGPLRSLADRLEARDSSAAREVDDRARVGLIRLIKGRRSRGPGTREDDEDIAQTVFRTFFRRASAGEFAGKLDGLDEAWALLATIAARKSHNRRRREMTLRRSVSREVSAAIEPLAIAPEEDGPEFLAALHEASDRLFQVLTPIEKQILESDLERVASTPEVAQALGVSERKVQRARETIRRILQRWDASSGGEPWPP